MTVEELIAELQKQPPKAEVEMNFDTSDQDTTFEVYEVHRDTLYGREVVIIKGQ